MQSEILSLIINSSQNPNNEVRKAAHEKLIKVENENKAELLFFILNSLDNFNNFESTNKKWNINKR